MNSKNSIFLDSVNLLGKLFLRTVLIAAGLVSTTSIQAAQTFDVDLLDSIEVKTGYMTFAASESLEPEIKENSFTNISIDISRFHKKIFASYFGYRIVRDSDLERVVYNSGSMGLKYFYRGLGTPIRARRYNSLVSWDIPFKPYVNVGVSIGKMLIQSFGDNDVLEFSSEFLGAHLGFGFNYSILENVALDVVIQAEQVFGYGPVDFKSLNLMNLIGFKYYY